MILALDLSSHCGWASGVPGALPECGVLELPGLEDLGRQGAAFSDGLAQLFTFGQPTEIIAEVDVNLHKQNAASIAEMQLGMIYFLRVICYRRKIPLYRATASNARTLVLGRARWDKAGDAKIAVLGYAREAGLRTNDHNAADAFVLWQYRCHRKNRAQRIQ